MKECILYIFQYLSVYFAYLCKIVILKAQNKFLCIRKMSFLLFRHLNIDKILVSYDDAGFYVFRVLFDFFSSVK